MRAGHCNYLEDTNRFKNRRVRLGSIAYLKMVRALLIRPEPLHKILIGNKTWEMRGSATKIRETIGLIPSRSGTVLALCDLVDCIGPLS